MNPRFLAAELVGVLILFDERNTSITTSKKSRAINPPTCIPASNDMISDSGERWDTDVCFLPIQLLGTNVRLLKIHTTHLRLILGPQGHQQDLSLGINPVDSAEPCNPHDDIVGGHLCDECTKSNELNVCHKFLSICV